MRPSHSHLVPRALLALLCVAALAFVVVGLRAARAEAGARDITARQPLRGSDVEEALASFRDAQRLNPDTSPDLAAAALLSTQRRYREAIAVLDGVVRSEPENADAWTGILGAAQESDPARAGEAGRRLRELKPPVGD